MDATSRKKVDNSDFFGLLRFLEKPRIDIARRVVIPDCCAESGQGEYHNAMQNSLEVSGYLPIHAIVAGMLISRGVEQHMDRVITCFDLIFVREGTLPIQEEEQAFQITAGQTLLLWPGRRHWGTAAFSPDLRFYWLHFNMEEPQSKEAAGSDNFFSVPQHGIVSRPDFLENLFRRYLNDQETGRLLPSYANLLACLMLSEIADQRSAFASDRPGAALAARVLAYIRSHLHQPMTVSEIADELGYNPEYLNRVFHQTYQHTLTQEIHLSRIGYARHLLLHSNKNSNEIAHACGFTDTKYFFVCSSDMKVLPPKNSGVFTHGYP